MQLHQQWRTCHESCATAFGEQLLQPINISGLLQLPNFNALFLVSLLAAFMSISYSTIGWVSAVAEGKAADVSYALLGSGTAKIMGIFNALGTMVFAYGGHSVVLEIQVWSRISIL